MAAGRDDEAVWQRAELTDDNGALGRPRNLWPLDVPDTIILDDTGEWLLWDDSEETIIIGEPVQFHTHPQSHSLDMLNRFVRLETASPKRVLDFAKCYGPLRIAEASGPPAIPGGVALPAAVPGKPGWRREPLVLWRHYAYEARYLLNQAVDLFGPGLGETKELWYDRVWFVERVNLWLEWGDVRSQLQWWKEYWRVAHQPRGLFGLLALQLADAISYRAGMAICDGCGEPYKPRQVPKAGRRRYCPTCRGNGIPKRDARRDYAARQREGKVGGKQGGGGGERSV